MKLSTIFGLLISCTLVTAPATAGWFDDLFAKEEVKPVATQAQDTNLVSNVMSQLGLNQSQAEGGLGSLLTLAKSSLGGNDFSSIASAIPDINQLLSAAPTVDNESGMSGLLSKAGDLGASLQGGAQVYDAFEKLGISKDLAAPMINIVKGYLDTHAGNGTSDLLMKGLSAVL
ncbi:MAG: hypothetical protein ACI90A_001232 [Shewanella sp.]|jgi:hypothetical protein